MIQSRKKIVFLIYVFLPKNLIFRNRENMIYIHLYVIEITKVLNLNILNSLTITWGRLTTTIRKYKTKSKKTKSRNIHWHQNLNTNTLSGEESHQFCSR